MNELRKRTMNLRNQVLKHCVQCAATRVSLNKPVILKAPFPANLSCHFGLVRSKSMGVGLSWEGNSLKIIRFSALYGNLNFIIVFTSAHYLPLTRTNSIQSTPSCSISLRSILIALSSLLLGLPMPSLQVSPQKFCMNFLFSHTLLPHPRSFHHTNNNWWVVQITKLLSMQLSSVSCYFHHFKPNSL